MIRGLRSLGPILIWGTTLPAADFEEIRLPALVIKGKPARAHTQGLVVQGKRVFITARREDVSPRRSLLLTSRGGEAFRIWDITPNLSGSGGARDVLDHPGGFDSDGERLWIPISHSRRDGRTVVRAYEIASLLAENKATPITEFPVDDHIGAIAVSTQRDEIYGANWDTLKVYVWNLDGKEIRSFTRKEFVTDLPDWSNAVQDWKVAGKTLVASGLDKNPRRPSNRPRAILQAIDLSSRKLLWEVRFPRRPEGDELTREGMAIREGTVWFLPKDLGVRNRLFRIELQKRGR